MEQEQTPVISFDKPLKKDDVLPIATARLHQWMKEYEQELEMARVQSLLIPGQMLTVHFEDRYETDVNNLRPKYETRWKQFLETPKGQAFQENWKRTHREA